MALRFHLPDSSRTLHRVLFATALAASFALVPSSVPAQQTMTCFPTCDSTDGRFLALSGTAYNTFAGDVIMIGIGVLPTASNLDLGIFDGETGNMWDIGSTPLEYSLYADPNGNGEGATLLHQWLGTSMVDNGWWNYRMANVDAARSTNGNYVYMLRVRMVDTTAVSTSSFKVRSSGTITIKSHQAFSIYAPLTREADARVIYPNYPDLSTTTYDGSWRIWLEFPTPCTDVTIWDGDMDRGSFDGSVMDSDDPDTRNDVVPSWATPATVLEGNATSAWTIRDPNRPGSTIRMSGDPADNNLNPLYRKGDAITYAIISPVGDSYQNADPSGNLEWEQFRIDTAPFDRNLMDYHADALATGMYEVRVAGMDMGNVNAWRFFNTASGVSNVEVVGVDATGAPVAPLRAAEFVDGVAAGTVYYDSDGDQAQGPGEPGIPAVGVTLRAIDAAGQTLRTVNATSDQNGRFSFGNLPAGAYSVAVNAGTLEPDAVATTDADGASTAGVASFSISAAAATEALPFGYRRASSPGTLTRGYWANHPEDWPLAFISLGYVVYTKEQALGFLQRATAGDRTYSMAAQLIATKLNLALGNSSECIGETVVAADDWLYLYPIGSGSTIRCDWTSGSPIHKRLDDYNNGRLCVAHMN